jgi:uncharacterized Fe-S cluster protein YjdI
MTEEQLLQADYRKYSGEAIDVFYNISKCVHAGKCVKGSIEAFNPKRKPWVIADAETADRIAEIIDTCPAGALQYIKK